jgi:hypothetical protein
VTEPSFSRAIWRTVMLWLGIASIALAFDTGVAVVAGVAGSFIVALAVQAAFFIGVHWGRRHPRPPRRPAAGL